MRRTSRDEVLVKWWLTFPLSLSLSLSLLFGLILNGSLFCVFFTWIREAKALMGANKRAEQIGVGVTRAAQSVFDSVNKTLPCRWQGKDIVVIGEVTIVSPYGLDNCTVVPGAEKTLDQVKKVLSS